MVQRQVRQARVCGPCRIAPRYALSELNGGGEREMKDAQKPDHISLSTLIGRLKEGRFVIPDFQRKLEWQPWDIRDLVRSIFLDYYIGSLLPWKGKPENFGALACEPIYGFNDSTGSAENQTRRTWPKVRRELDRIHIGAFTGPAGTFRRLTDPAKPARDLLAMLNIDQPRKIHKLTAPRT
ncbi:MAG TPA: DUF262 domain-containing protein [Streptosporangiaceae bacterium]|nr:DUF262 domain-containing protein [Streptosporangiaceae bacterium]